MLELDQALSAYLSGGTLPDGTVPTYSELLPGDAENGLTQVVAVPLENWGYGTDLSCLDDFLENMGEVESNSTIAVVQSNYRRLNTPAGFLTLIGDDPEFGKDIIGLLQKGVKPTDIKKFEDGIIAQLLLDDRNKTVNCTITEVANPYGLVVDLGGTTSSGGNYSLVMALTDGSVLIQALNLDSRGNTNA